MVEGLSVLPDYPRSGSWTTRWFARSRLYVAGRDARLDVVVRVTLGLGSASVAVSAGVAAIWRLAAPGPGTVVLWVVSAAALVSLVMWAVSPVLLRGWQTTAFAFVADVGVGAGLTTLHDRRLMFGGCMLFALIGGFVTIHVPPVGVIMHSLFTTAFTVNAAVLMSGKEGVSPAISVLGAAVWLWVLVGAPVTIRRIWVGTSAAAEQASYDPLTGALNRVGLAQAYRALAARAESRDEAMVVIAVDLDEFKAVNDRYGHQVGDAVIKETARHLVNYFGPSAVVARLGGEEFTVVIAGWQTELFELVRATPTATPGIHGPAVTMSVGAATCDFRSAHDPLRQAIATADRAMYTAKHRGGNSIHVQTTRIPPRCD